MRPASGCSWAGSGNEAGERKDDISSAVVGLMGVDLISSSGVKEDEVEEDEDEEDEEDRRPVRVSQNDAISIFKKGSRWSGGSWRVVGFVGGFNFLV